MKTIQFKTNINCSGCVAKVTPVLNALSSVEKWAVDITNPGKILTVETTEENKNAVVETVKKAGFNISEL